MKAAMDTIRHAIADAFDAGDLEALDRIEAELNAVLADLLVLRQLLDPPAPDPTDPELEHLEMEPSRPACVKYDFTCGRETP